MKGFFDTGIDDDRALPFRDRTEAGRVLAAKLAIYAGRPDVLVLALPRGGVVVGFEVAQALHAPLDVFVVRKLGVPGHEELAMGAIAPGKVRVIDERIVRTLDISERTLEAVAETEEQELERRERTYRGDRPKPEFKGRTVILVDDGLATGSTMRAAIAALRKENPARIVVGVPIAASSTCQEFRAEVDEIVCAKSPEPFYAIGQWYESFSQLTDAEVHALLEAARERHARAD
jgi:putative phosphoribosyl transferase